MKEQISKRTCFSDYLEINPMFSEISANSFMVFLCVWTNLPLTGAPIHLLLRVWKVKVKVPQTFCVTLLKSSLSGSSVHGILQTWILEWEAIPFSTGSSQPNDWTQSFPLQVNSLLAEPPGKPKNTEAGSLSLLQWIFLTQDSNQGLLHCRQILYQLNNQRSPYKMHMHLCLAV